MTLDAHVMHDVDVLRTDDYTDRETGEFISVIHWKLDGKDMVEIWVADDDNGLNAKVRIGVKINEGAKSGAQ